MLSGSGGWGFGEFPGVELQQREDVSCRRSAGCGIEFNSEYCVEVVSEVPRLSVKKIHQVKVVVVFALGALRSPFSRVVEWGIK